MRISDWSSDVGSSDLVQCTGRRVYANIGTDELSEAARSRLKEVRWLVAAKRNTDFKGRNGRKTGAPVAIHAARQINGVAMLCGSREISEPGRKLLVQWSNKAGAKQGIHKLRRGHRSGNVLHRAVPCCTRLLCGSSAALARDGDAHSNTPIS